METTKKVKIKNWMEFDIKKGDEIEITKEFSDYYIGTHVKRGITSIVKVKKQNCLVI